MNTKIAVAIDRGMETIACAYIFAILMIIGFPGFHSTPTAYVQWVSQTFVQLVALSVLAVGQSILGRHQELQAEETFQTSEHCFHDIEQIMQHLCAQDAELLHHTRMLMHLLEKNGISLQQVEAEMGHTGHLETYAQSPTTAASAPPTPAPAEGEKQST